MRNYIWFAGLFTIVLSGCGEAPGSQVPDRPNIIFLLTDDHRWDALGAMGNTIVQTPNLDTLANQGYHFVNAYVTTSICAVSRASILTGQYGSRHGINDFQKGLPSEVLDLTYPLVLKQEGYRIGFIGKYGVGDVKYHPNDLFDYWACTEKVQPQYENIDQDGNYLHYTDLVSSEMQKFISSNDERPFCLSVSFKAPHVQDGDERQFIPNPRYDGLYDEIEIPQPITADEKYWKSFPDFFRTDDNIGRERWGLRFDTEEKYQNSVKNYYRLITGVDEVIGELRKRLKSEGIDHNTVIIFMGDNGMFLGEHGLAGKWYPYEESIRVPLIIYDPREEGPKETISDIALNIDVAPTILRLADVEIPISMQGIDLLKEYSEDEKRTSFFYEHSFLGSPKIPVSEAIVSPQLKYIIYPEHGHEELYDLIQDPYEKLNLANNTDYKDLLDKQRETYANLKQEVLK